MGTDRTIEYSGPCLCGKGKVTIDECTPDHSWPTSQKLWYESHLECPECKKTYAVKRIGNKFAWVTLEALKMKDAEQEAIYDIARKIDECSSIVQAKTKAIEQLAQAGTGASCHRLLKEAGIEDRTYGAFQRRWSGPDSYINTLSRYYYPHLLKMTGVNSDGFDALDAQYKALEMQHEAAPPTVGGSIYTIPPNRFA